MTPSSADAGGARAEAARLRAEADRLDRAEATRAALLADVQIGRDITRLDGETSALLLASRHDAGLLDFARLAEIAEQILACYARCGAPDEVLAEFSVSAAELAAAVSYPHPAVLVSALDHQAAGFRAVRAWHQGGGWAARMEAGELPAADAGPVLTAFYWRRADAREAERRARRKRNKQ